MSESDRLQMIVVAIVLAGVAVAAIFVLLHISRSKKSNPQMRFSTPAWVWIALLVPALLIGWSLGGPRKPDRPDRPAASWMVSLLPAIAGVGIFVSLIGYQLYRQTDRIASRALKRGQSGETAEAIADLRAAMGLGAAPDGPSASVTADPNPYASPAGRGRISAARANTMGLLHWLREDWTEALDWFREAERLGGQRSDFLANQGVVLWKLGRPEGAVGLLEEACTMTPGHPLHPCNLGHVLMELGRSEEAREQLKLAESNFKKFLMFPPSAKKPIAAEIEKLRQKLGSGEP